MSAFTPRILAGCVFLSLALSACGGGRARGVPPAGAPDPVTGANAPAGSPARRVPVSTDAVNLYRRLGLLAEGGETPFVGSLSFFAGRSPDSTLMVLSVSLPNRSLRFTREGDRYRSGYRVGLEVKRGTEVLKSLSSDETVRVLAFRETQRSDESVIFRRVVSLAPGMYDLRLTVRGDSVNNGSAIEATIGVPRLADGALSSPVAFFEATPRIARDSLPRFVATPRSTVVFGRDTLLPLYVEGYGTTDNFPVQIQVRPEGATNVLWSDSVSLPKQGNLFGGVIQVPLQRLGVGVMVASVNRAGGSDTLRAPIFIAFGEDLPVATFSEMLDYLRYFANTPRLSAMRDAPAEQRAVLWADFIRDSDPNPSTAAHEGLRDYFARLAQANLRFREEGGPGWLTDRGRVFVTLGTPDQILEPNMNNLNQRGRTQIWEYRQHRLSIVMVDQSGFGRWRMTLTSETEFEATARRIMVQ